MKWGGKIIGGSLGMLALGPVGAAIGAFIGHQFDTGAAAGVLGYGGGHGGGPAQVNALFFPTTFRVMGHIAKADGRVSEREIASARAVMTALHLSPVQIAAAIGYFEEGKRTGFDLDQALRPLVAAIAPYPEVARFFLEIQLQAAIAGDGVSDRPRARLQHVAQRLGIGLGDYARMESALRWSQNQGGNQGEDLRGSHMPGPSSAERLRQDYGLLEADATGSNDDVVKAYRRQMSRHHPDKLKANGLPDSMLERAKERTQQIQAAYERVRQARGMS